MVLARIKDYCAVKCFVVVLCFLAYLSGRLIGELIVYPWSGVRRRPWSTMLKHLLLRNCFAD